jgi:hypothetical protein
MRRACALALLGWLSAGSFVTAAEGGEAPQNPKPPAFEPARIRGFNVTLVLGEMQGTATPDNLPPGAKKALDDMRSFLPYKSFRLLDSQWILCCATGGFADIAATAVAGRLRGVDEQEYGFSVTILNMSGPQLSVRFLMHAAAGSLQKKISSAASESRGVERASVELQLLEAQRELQQRHEAREVPDEAAAAARARVDRLERHLAELTPVAGGGKGAVIDSTFSMDVGETVVIGTSSLKGEKALIALLTAAPRAGSTSAK